MGSRRSIFPLIYIYIIRFTWLLINLRLLKESKPSHLAFLSDWDTGGRNNLKMDHLVCFMPGTMALGAYTDPQGLSSKRAQRDLSIAKALMYTCREMYHRTASGEYELFIGFFVLFDVYLKEYRLSL